MEESKPRFEVAAPIVIDRKKGKKKRKKRYSDSLKDIQIMEADLTRVSHRVVRAVDRGFAGYRGARKKSARKRRDGAIVDFAPNVARGMGETLRAASPLPYDLVRAVYPKTARRMFRRQVKFASRLVDDLR